MKKLLIRTVPLGVLLAAILTSQPATFEVVVTRNVIIPMRDGVKLAADLYRPARNGTAAAGKFPVLMTRTPYSKDGGSREANNFAAQGYIVVVQDGRGRYQSEGHWIPIRDDPNDGFDTAKCIGTQAWSTHTIGAYGTPYGGPPQHALASATDPF